MLVEDQVDFRHLIATLLGRQQDLEVVAQAGSLAEAHRYAVAVHENLRSIGPGQHGFVNGGAWESAGVRKRRVGVGEFADKFNAMPKFVVSTTLKDPEWNNTTVLDSGDATAQVRKLKEEFDGELQVPGSHRLVQELIESDLVDQINLMVFPVILGTGKKVFEEKPERRNLRLKESKVVGDGVLVLIYERAADRG